MANGDMDIQKAIKVSKVFLNNPSSKSVWEEWMKVFSTGPCGFDTVRCHTCPMLYYREHHCEWWICAQPFYKLGDSGLDESKVALALIEFIAILEIEKEKRKRKTRQTRTGGK